MGACLDVAGVEAANLGHELGRELVAQRELLRRRQPRGDDGALLAREVERDQAGLLLEHQPVAGDLAAMANARPRQHEGGADIGMAGERHLGLGREDADFGRVGGVLGRQHEGRLGEVEFGRDRLHLLGREAARVAEDGQRIAAEFAIREDVHGDEIEFHDFKSATAG